MLKGILDYIPTRKKARLIQQWVEKSGLPEEEVTPGLRKRQPLQEDLSYHSVEQESIYKPTVPISVKHGIVSLPLKYILLGISLFTLQLVLLSILSTIIIMQP